MHGMIFACLFEILFITFTQLFAIVIHMFSQVKRVQFLVIYMLLGVQ